MATIGIFWVYKNTVMGNAREFSEGQETCPGMLDSPDCHVDLWQEGAGSVILFQELRDTEYQDVPRGRVVYSTEAKQSIVYMDKVLHTARVKRAVVKFFQLGDVDIEWETDAHYTTDPDQIEAMFD